MSNQPKYPKVEAAKREYDKAYEKFSELDEDKFSSRSEYVKARGKLFDAAQYAKSQYQKALREIWI